MEVGFTTTYAIGVYLHYSCKFEPSSWRGILDTTLCDKVCQTKTDRHDITDLILSFGV